MRFNEFKIIKEAAENIAIIGDSIAVGIKGAGGASAGNAVGGSNTKQVLGFVTDFVQSDKAKGATVILSSGAANSANVSTVDGKKLQSENLGPVSAQIKQLKAAGATVVLVGVASGKTPPQKPTRYTNGKQWIIDYTGMNDQLAAIASANGATFLGPLEEFDPEISKGDGIHPVNGYGKLFKAGSAGAGITLGPKDAEPGAPASKDKDATARAFRKDGSFYVKAPAGRSGPEVADVQKALIALGYSLPKYGVDGIRGAETIAAVKKFQQDNKLTVDGDPGPQTVAALNTSLDSNPEVAKTLRQSTIADVKVKNGGSTISPADVADYLKSKGLDSNQILGILANIQGESSFRPGVMGDNGASGGLFQHHKTRFTSMVAAAGDDWATNWKGQIDFALTEQPGRAYMNIKFKTPEEATAWWTKYFEIPADIPGDTRKRIAMLPNFQNIV